MSEKIESQLNKKENKETIREVFNFKQKNGNAISFLSNENCWQKSRKGCGGMPLAEGILCDIILKTPEKKNLSFKKEFLPDGWHFEIITSATTHANPKRRTVYLSHPYVEEIDNRFYSLMIIHEAKHAEQEECGRELTTSMNLWSEYEAASNKESALKFLRHYSKMERNAWAETLKEYRQLNKNGINITNANPDEIRNFIDKECLGSRLRTWTKDKKHKELAKILKEYLTDSNCQEKFFTSKTIFKSTIN